MLTVFRKIWRFSVKEQKNLKESILFGFLNAVFNALQFGAIYYMLMDAYKDQLSTKTIQVVVGIILVSVVGKVLTQNGSQMRQTHAGYFMAAHKRQQIGDKLKKVPMGFFSNFSLGRLTTLSTTNLSQIEMWVPMLLVLVLGGILNSLIFVLSLFFFSIKIGIVAVIGVVVFFVITSAMEKSSRKNAHLINQAQTELTKEVLANVQGMQVIKSYNLTGENNKKLNNVFEEYRKNLLKLEKIAIPYIVMQRIAIAITITAMVIVSIQLYINGELILPKAIMSVIASFIIFDGLVGAGSSMAILRIAENAIDNLNYVDEIPNMEEGCFEGGLKDFNIEFKDVEFGYSEKNLFDGINCRIQENQMTAVVGPSGCGKTTFCNLIARFWDVNSGSITIGNKDVRDFTLEGLMQNISMVFQNVYLFEDSIENNIKFGTPTASREEVVKAAKKARCHDFIVKLPEGYDTVIGEGGASLSGGEKQRISIARAMLKDAPIIILDEATANVDMENEDKLQEAIESLTKSKTIIMIAHRLKTIKNADQILVFNDGKIVERGKHEDLIKQDGLYRTLVEAKNKSVSWKI